MTSSIEKTIRSAPSTVDKLPTKSEAAKYLESNEIDYFLKVLVKEVLLQSPEDPISFAMTFFRRVRNCTYITNRDISFIRESRYNRGSFIIICREMFAKLLQLDFTAYDFFNIIDLCFQGFTVSYISKIVAYLDPSVTSETLDQYKYRVQHLLCGLEFFIFYENWLNELTGLVSKTSEAGVDFPVVKRTIPLRTLRNWVKSLRYDLLSGPNKEIILSLADELAEQFPEADIPVETIRRALILNERVREELSSALPKVAMDTSVESTHSSSAVAVIGSTFTATAAVAATSTIATGVISQDDTEE